MDECSEKGPGVIRRGVIRALSEEGARLFFKSYFRFFHRVVVEGLHHIPEDRRGLIIIANHASLIDGILLWTYLKMDLTIVVDRRRAREFLFRPFMRNWYTVEIDTMNPFSLKGLIEKVKEGKPLLIFPEGRTTRTGNLMKIYEGTGFIAYKTGARILPVHLGNTFSTIFSRKKSGRRLFEALSITVFPPRELPALDGYAPKRRKMEAAASILDMLCQASYEAGNRPSTLGRELIRSCRRYGGSMLYKDATGKVVTYRKALIAAFALGKAFSRLPYKRVAILLPNLTVTALVMWALQLWRKVPVFLNYSGGAAAVRQGLELAATDVVITSRQFLERLKISETLFGATQVIFAEDLKDAVTFADRAGALYRAFVPGSFARMVEGGEKETAVVLFTSGSEGVPKGVPLSHENIISNVHQSLARFDVTEEDYFLNVLPLFHSFGLTVGTILPLMAGARSYLYVNPLHYRLVPEIAYDEGCTIFMATNTFLRGYSRRAHPFDFHTIRSIFCGGEGLSDEVFESYAKNFGIRIMTGYGATECSPIVSINTPLEYRYGTVGRILPGIGYRIAAIEGVDDKGGRAGRLFLKGKNVFQGYITDGGPKGGHPVDGWYDTGDIVEMTADGFLKILGRLKRFAKVSGEMISLGALEEALWGVFGEKTEIVVVAQSDEKKGERLMVVTDNRAVDLKGIREALKARGFTELAMPKEVRYLYHIPKLGTGKTDYIALRDALTLP
jgi:acyl-[acyl-carrier-protein]-phospholipid O-acyltransferase / long-chain-fatty-acid--[acyl-carrier-protein] ligase